MPIDKQLDRSQRQRLRQAERKLKEARLRLARTERSIAFWAQIVADLKYQRTRAIQHPLWPEENQVQKTDV
jgi:hypothetical protein